MNAAKAFAFLLAVQIVLPLPAESQEDEKPPRYPVAVIEVERLAPGTGPFEVIRRPDLSPNDVILLTADATPALLSQAVWTLMIAHQREPGVPTREQRIQLSDSRAETAGLREPPWAKMVLEDLSTAQVVGIQGFGYKKAVIIFLPREQSIPFR